jgi:hypothetical protein
MKGGEDRYMVVNEKSGVAPINNFSSDGNYETD